MILRRTGIPTSRMLRLRLLVLPYTLLFLAMNVCFALQQQQQPPPKIAVFGGSGYIGRRVCQILVQAGCDVVSISTSGKPPSYYCNPTLPSTTKNEDSSSSSSWSDHVEWVSHTIHCGSAQEQQTYQQNEEDGDTTTSTSSTTTTTMNNLAVWDKIQGIDAAISCVGNLQPTQDWKGLFGLGFNTSQLEYDNGHVNVEICQLVKQATRAERFVYISVNYETAKALEGAIEGYLNGKRLTERTACQLFGIENTIVLGPCWVYGGRRFPRFGALYRNWIIDSPVTKLYLQSMNVLRNLSSAPMEDWVEKMILECPPVEVDVIARVAVAAALGKITRRNNNNNKDNNNNKNVVGDRRQGFFDTNGQPVIYDNILMIDGALELERVNGLISTNEVPVIVSPQTKYDPSSSSTSSSSSSSSQNEEEPWAEGALIGKSPWLKPLPVIATFATIFYGIATQQFVQVVNNPTIL